MKYKLEKILINQQLLLILLKAKMNPQIHPNQSIKLLDHSLIQKNQLNTSSSKMQYSFPKSSRFSQQSKSFSPNKYYQLPSTKVNRSTSFGYGNKIDLSKTNFISPPPNKYNLESDFKEGRKSGFTIAQGRQDVKANDMFFRPLKQCPEPGTYNPKSSFTSLKYSIHSKIDDKLDKWVKSVPGPGTYTYLNLTKQSGKSPVAKHYSVRSGKFDQLPRLSQAEMMNNKNPAPNQYKNTAEIINQFKFTKKGGSVFAKGARKGIIQKSITPGPGNYATFSQF